MPTPTTPKRQPFRWRALSRKQKQVFTWWHPSSPVHHLNGIIADGAIRSGKSLCMSTSFVLWAMTTFDGHVFGLCGKTIGSFRRNVLFWLKVVLPGIGCTVEDRRSENLVVIRRRVHGVPRENHFYLFGGKDESSQDLIQGITLAGVFFDEVALMPESFVNQATGRCSVPGSKLWFNCNPGAPEHWFHVKWVRRAADMGMLHLRFTMDDNPALEDAEKQRYRSIYSGVFFQRYVLGEWTVADGIVFSMFDAARHVRVDEGPFDRHIVAVDYGTSNPCTFGLYGVRRDPDRGDRYHLRREFYHDGRASGQRTDAEYAADMAAFVGDTPIEHIIVDPSAASFIAQLRRGGWRVVKGRNDVLDGIRTVSTAYALDLFTTDPSCVKSIAERHAYIWDEKAALRGEDAPVKQHDHTCDRDRYALHTDRRLHAHDGRRSYSGKGAMA